MPRTLPAALTLAALALLTLAAAPALAQCEPAMFTPDNAMIQLGHVTGAPRSVLYAAPAACADPACHGRPYLVPGNPVLLGAATGGYRCALYKDRYMIIGWLKEDQVAPEPPPAAPPPLSAWAGDWQLSDNQITLRPKGTALVAHGDAYYPSANPPLSERPYGPNLGEMAGTATPAGDRVTFGKADELECQVTLRLLRPFLISSDNGNCGGFRVTFSGVYRRQ